MKNSKSLYIIFFIAGLLAFSCQQDDPELGAIVAPSNLTATAEIVGQDTDNPYGDGSGIVNFNVSADNAITYKIVVEGKDYVSTSEDISTRVTRTGVNIYTFVIVAYGTGGVSTSISMEIEVYSAFDDVQVKSFLTGAPIITDADGNETLAQDQAYSKTWYWAANLPLHVGLGPVEDDYGGGEFAYEAWWNAIQPFDAEKDCMYTSEFVFTSNTDGSITFEQTEGLAYVPGAYAGVIGVDGELCYDETTFPELIGEKEVSFLPSSSKAATEGTYNNEPYRGTSFQISDDGFMSWFVGSGLYDIITIDNDFMRVRVIQDGSIYADGGYAWYQLLSSTNPYDAATGFDSDYTDLIWQDEFDTNGAPDSSKWTAEIGTGVDGWGNFEEQYYTDDASNLIVEDGLLKITAEAESFMGSDYTSARITTQDKLEFTHGRVEIRAKLPQGGGTWPAFWMLGANFDTVGWPASGEIDIMEHVGNNQNEVLATVHWDNGGSPANFSQSTTVSTASDEFHIYTLEWRPDEILMLVDDMEYFTFSYDSSFPFDQDFFLIFNVAMGGTLGGTIDSGFSQSTMEIDYVRVYQ